MNAGVEVLNRWQGAVVYRLQKVGSTKLLANEQPIPGLFLSVLRVPLAHLHLCWSDANLSNFLVMMTIEHMIKGMYMKT